MTSRHRLRSPSWLLPGALTAAGAVLVLAGVMIGTHRPATQPVDVGTVPVAAPVGPSIRSGDDARSARTAGPARRRPAPASPPVTVRLPDAKASHVVPVTTGATGTLDPPARVDQVGWWRGGAAVGDPGGSVVLVGHVDAAGQGKGTFAALWSARPGGTVHLATRSGRDVRYRITGLRSYSRRQPLPSGIFETDGAPRLVMITCAGRFDTRTGHYSDSLVVYAVPDP